MPQTQRSERELTDLEAVTLAYILRRQPCTPYQVRCSFDKSTTTRFSSSAGSIYPLIKRLHDRGFLTVDDDNTDARGSRRYSATREGHEQVQNWITGISDPADIGIYDPIRSRLLNLSLLPESARTSWLESMLELVQSQIEVIRDYETQSFEGDSRLYEISRDAVREEHALRLRYLKRALAILTGNQHES